MLDAAKSPNWPITLKIIDANTMCEYGAIKNPKNLFIQKISVLFS